MKEIPVLYKPNMVNAIMGDAKTNTRRVINRLLSFGKITEFGPSDTPGYDWHFRNKRMLWNDISTGRLMECCPWGKPGDLLWVRETWNVWLNDKGRKGYTRLISFQADGGTITVPEEHFKWFDEKEERGYLGRPSIHLPKWASRIWLKVKSIRVERLQDISEEDALSEGIERSSWKYSCEPYRNYNHTRMQPGYNCSTSIMSFSTLWDSINGKSRKDGQDISWDANPWVWVVEFERAEKPETTKE